MTEQTVSRWERGTTAIPDDQKVRLADEFSRRLATDISVEYLMGWDRIPAGTGEAAA